MIALNALFTPNPFGVSTKHHTSDATDEVNFKGSDAIG